MHFIFTEFDTCNSIQVEHGLTGSFKDRPIADWLAKHNPSPLEYERAVHNFTASCAGYSVATYVFGKYKQFSFFLYISKETDGFRGM